MIDVVNDKYTLMFGDCLERMKEIPDGSVDLCVSDVCLYKKCVMCYNYIKLIVYYSEVICGGF